MVCGVFVQDWRELVNSPPQLFGNVGQEINSQPSGLWIRKFVWGYNSNFFPKNLTFFCGDILFGSPQASISHEDLFPPCRQMRTLIHIKTVLSNRDWFLRNGSFIRLKMRSQSTQIIRRFQASFAWIHVSADAATKRLHARMKAEQPFWVTLPSSF